MQRFFYKLNIYLKLKSYKLKKIYLTTLKKSKCKLYVDEMLNLKCTYFEFIIP